MTKLHEKIKNFYVRSIKPLLHVEVLSESGWTKIKSVNVTERV